jgi:redox-sensitive bicupin YhaK (pirin superfamily)
LHYPAAGLPQVRVGAATVRVIIGTAFGATSPVTQHSPTLYLEGRMPAGAALDLPAPAELAVYVVAGSVRASGERIDAGTLGVARPGTGLRIEADAASHLVAIGGAPVGERHIWWNYVSSSLARIEQAKEDWKAGRFGKVPGDDEFIPLPG